MNEFSMEPEFTTRISFPMGVVLPADDPVAQWIVNLGRASNDLLIANRRLNEGFRLDTPAEEHFYDIRAIATHSWELVKFIDESRRDHLEIASFMANLDPQKVEDYEVVARLLDAEPKQIEEGKTWSFKAALASARDQASHYSKVGHKLLTSAMARVSDQEGEILVGRDYKDFNALFAATIDAQMFHPLDHDPEPFRKFSDQLQRVVGTLVRLTRNATDAYFLARQDHLEVEDY